MEKEGQYLAQMAELDANFPDRVVKLFQFLVGDMIGEGAFGRVHKGVDRATQPEVAVKQLSDADLVGPKLRRYVCDVRAIALCDHAFIIPFFGFTTERPFCIVTEFMSHGNLASAVRIKRAVAGDTVLSGSQLTAVAMGIAQEMAHLHSLGIIHRDLKTESVLLNRHYFPKTADFGTARLTHDTGTLGTRIGTPSFMAPEMIDGNSYDHKNLRWRIHLHGICHSTLVRPAELLSIRSPPLSQHCRIGSLDIVGVADSADANPGRYAEHGQVNNVQKLPNIPGTAKVLKNANFPPDF
jgi:serine/threonine protein kinase